MNWEQGSAVSFLGLHKSDFCYSVFKIQFLINENNTVKYQYFLHFTVHRHIKGRRFHRNFLYLVNAFNGMTVPRYFAHTNEPYVILLSARGKAAYWD